MSKNIDKYLHKEFDRVAGKQHAYKRTKIVATVGPACDSYDQLLQLVRAGVYLAMLERMGVQTAKLGDSTGKLEDL